mmetsp:Transcript_28807/g.79389  ORF Transcript_28807/g.79389 Transcript_28807/m.79389 type:complete len:320 (-) Transcript_28807:1066-2025(-)
MLAGIVCRSGRRISKFSSSFWKRAGRRFTLLPPPRRLAPSMEGMPTRTRESGPTRKTSWRRSASCSRQTRLQGCVLCGPCAWASASRAWKVPHSVLRCRPAIHTRRLAGANSWRSASAYSPTGRTSWPPWNRPASRSVSRASWPWYRGPSNGLKSTRRSWPPGPPELSTIALGPATTTPMRLRTHGGCKKMRRSTPRSWKKPSGVRPSSCQMWDHVATVRLCGRANAALAPMGGLGSSSSVSWANLRLESRRSLTPSRARSGRTGRPPWRLTPSRRSTPMLALAGSRRLARRSAWVKRPRGRSLSMAGWLASFDGTRCS